MTYKEFLNEENVGSSSVITGADVAALCGMSDIYEKGKAMIARDNEMMENFKSDFSSLVNRINESDKKRFMDVID
jgi:hypothetical protein